MLHYLLYKTLFKYIAAILLGIIISLLTLKLTTNNLELEYSSIFTWFALWCLYIWILPFTIYKKSQAIYNNTKFMHKNMSFSFSTNYISWSADTKTIDFPIDKIYSISTTSKALIISFSPYQVIPIPFEFITQETWTNIITIIKPHFTRIRTHYYNSYYKKNEKKHD